MENNGGSTAHSNYCSSRRRQTYKESQERTGTRSAPKDRVLSESTVRVMITDLKSEKTREKKPSASPRVQQSSERYQKQSKAKRLMWAQMKPNRPKLVVPPMMVSVDELPT